MFCFRCTIGNTGGNMPHGQNAGYLGKMYDPLVLNSDPSDPNFRVPDMPAAGLPAAVARGTAPQMARDGGQVREQI